jgi:hypothetical protein
MNSKPLSFLLASTAIAVSASAASSWDLATDYAVPTNPNGAWTYGEVPGGSFSALAWNAHAWNPETGTYGVAAVGETFIYKRDVAGTDYGIAQGKVSLEADWGDPAVRWSAPTAGTYAFTIAIGGSTAWGTGGYGNMFAKYGGVKVNGIAQTEDAFVGNIKSWSFTAMLAAGGTVDTFVLNPGFANGGNTQTEISVSAVPEPASVLLLALGIGVLTLRRLQCGTGPPAAA